MVDVLVSGGTVVTVDDQRRVIQDGAVAVDGNEIVAVGPTADVESAYDADRVVDATDHAVFPGLISTHVHVSDILLRGGLATDRDHYDWLFNVKFPGVHHMTPEEHAVASALYCQEAVQGGVTTVVENAVGAGDGYDRDVVAEKMAVYDAAGTRNVYAHSFVDTELAPSVQEFVDLITSSEPEVNHPDRTEEFTPTDEALAETEALIEAYHDPEGRQSVWPGPVSPRSTTAEGLLGAYRLAEEYDVMATTHSSETAHDNEAVGGDHLSMVEWLHEIGFLGERAVLGHCVHLSERDVRLMKRSNTKAVHNPLTNLALAAGFSPVPKMLNYGITVGLGTDNTSGSDTINMVNDLRFAAMLHKAVEGDASAMTAEKALEMATIDNARALGREDELGSLEVGKRADLFLLDLDYPHLTPHTDPVSTLVYQAQGAEVDTVVCDGEIVMDDREVSDVTDRYPNLREDALAAHADIVERAGFEKLVDRPWTSI